MNSDTIFIHELKIETLIGILPWEQRVKQKVVLDLEMQHAIGIAAASHNINDTVDYSRVAHVITEYVSSRQFKLIETLAEEVAQLTLQQFKISRLRLSVSKPAAVANAKQVGVCIERSALNS